MTDEIKRYSNEEIEKIFSVKNRALPKDLIEQAKNVSLVDYIEKKGLMLQQSNRGKGMQLLEHDSLKVTPEKNAFYWFSQNRGGVGAIEFAKVYYEMDFRKAVRDVLENADEMIKPVQVERQAVVEEKPYDYKDHEMTTDTSRAEDYLVNKRMINPDLVEKLIDKGIIRQTEKTNNVAFMWQKSGSIVGHEERGTTDKRFMKIAAGVPEHRGFSVTFGKPENVFVFESTIDALSYATLYPPVNSRFISMNGVKENTMYQALKDIQLETGKLPDNVVICTDNDKAGQKFLEKHAVPIMSGKQETKMYQSTPPRFVKGIVNEKQDIKEIFKTIDNNSSPENELQINADDAKVYKDEENNWVFEKNDTSLVLNDTIMRKKEITELMKDVSFDVSYNATTKDWNEVLKHVKENNITLERPLRNDYEEMKAKEIDRMERKADKDEGMDR